MTKTFRFLLPLLLVYSNLFAQSNIVLSPAANISLITIGPGNELYTTFGHSTILIEDYPQNISTVYNYGTFSFETENFYLKFLRGTLPYQLTKSPFNSAIEYWTFENRLATKQQLNLTPEEKQELYKLLETNYLPQNRTYQYKFFYDNCSTRIRDIIEKVLGEKLILNKQLNADKSYRDWINIYAKHKPVATFGMNIAIGMPADQITGYNNAMYIPDNMMMAFDSAYVVRNGQKQPFVLNKSVINQMYVNFPEIRKEVDIPLILSVLLLLTYVYWFYLKKSVTIFDKILFAVLGISGWILLMLWFLTDHGVTRNNLNIFWAFPFIVPFLFMKKFQTPGFLRYLASAAAMVLIVDIFHVQDIPLAADIIALALVFRYVTLYRKLKNDTTSQQSR